MLMQITLSGEIFNYMFRELVLYDFFCVHCKNFTVYILAMDDTIAAAFDLAESLE